MMLEYFIQYFKVNHRVTDSTVSHYITALKTINTLLVKYEYPIKNVFDVATYDELNLLKQFTQSNEEFLLKDSIGHNMYSAAFNHFVRFAFEDEDFFQTSLSQMDIIVPKTIQENTSQLLWKRNHIIILQTIKAAHYCCEQNSKHTTFTSALTGKPYMEGHHIIPLKSQDNFETSIDVYANLVCLCPICHRLLHYGTKSEKGYFLEKLYDERYQRFAKSGIEVPKNEFIQLVI